MSVKKTFFIMHVSDYILLYIVYTYVSSVLNVKIVTIISCLNIKLKKG